MNSLPRDILTLICEHLDCFRDLHHIIRTHVPAFRIRKLLVARFWERVQPTHNEATLVPWSFSFLKRRILCTSREWTLTDLPSDYVRCVCDILLPRRTQGRPALRLKGHQVSNILFVERIPATKSIEISLLVMKMAPQSISRHQESREQLQLVLDAIPRMIAPTLVEAATSSVIDYGILDSRPLWVLLIDILIHYDLALPMWFSSLKTRDLEMFINGSFLFSNFVLDNK